MNRPDHIDATEKLNAYLLARVPTTIQTLDLASAIAQLLANDQGEEVGYVMHGRVAITRLPKIITLERRRA